MIVQYIKNIVYIIKYNNLKKSLSRRENKFKNKNEKKNFVYK